MILFAAVRPAHADLAFKFYKQHDEGLTGQAADMLAPYTESQFKQLIDQGSVWASMTDGGQCRSLCYASYSEKTNCCTLGGLLVAPEWRGKKWGSTVARLALAHMLVEENLLDIPEVRIVAHVLRRKGEPTRRFSIITDALKFEKSRRIPVAENDSIWLDEYELHIPRTLVELCRWARDWAAWLHDQKSPFQLDGEEVHVDFRHDMRIEDWADIVCKIAARHESGCA